MPASLIPVYTPAPGCSCTEDADCVDSDNCTEDSCVNGACVLKPIANCCNWEGDCDDDNICTTDLCLGGQCKHITDASCCFTDSDCNDYDSCTADTCEDNECVFSGISVCAEECGVLHTFSTTFVDDGFTMLYSDEGSWVTANYEAAIHVQEPVIKTYEPKTVQVEVGSNYYNPPHIEINYGDTVVWKVVGGKP